VEAVAVAALRLVASEGDANFEDFVITMRRLFFERGKVTSKPPAASSDA
jgi:hypothetical protein